MEKFSEILEKHVLWLETNGKNGVKADLQEANLQGADLQEANLQGANLQGANLQGADLQEAVFPNGIEFEEIIKRALKNE